MKELQSYIVTQNIGNFTTAEDETLIIAQREHWFSLVISMIVIASIALVSVFSSFFTFSYLLAHYQLFLISSFIITTIVLGLLLKLWIDWYFHLYIVTNKKILEVWYKPFFSEIINDVLLDQVRCTEVDTKIHGILYELMDIGDITLTFDRPTHQEEFTLHNIAHPRMVGMYLAKELGSSKNTNAQAWFRGGKGNRSFRFIEELFPQPLLNERTYA